MINFKWLHKSQKLIAIFLASGMLIISGCSSTPKQVTYYPTPDETSSNSETVGTDDTDDETLEEETEPEVELKIDNIRSNGRYIYEPTKIFIHTEDSSKGDVVTEAEIIMDAVNSVQTTVEFEGLNANEIMIKTAMTLAQISNPLCSTVEIQPDEDETYRIIYQNEEAKQREINEAFQEKVTQIIDDTIKPEYTDEQRAYAIYEYFVQNFVITYDPDNEEDPYTYITGADRNSMFVNSFLEGKMSIFEANYLYTFFLNQLNIHSTMVGSYGQPQEGEFEMLVDYFNNSQYGGSWTWVVVKIDDNYYHCDLGHDMIKAYVDRGDDIESSVEITYFGLSDKSRNKYYNSFYGADLLVANAAASTQIPTCEEDMKNYSIEK